MQLAVRQQGSGDDRTPELMRPSSKGKLSVCSVQLHPARGNAEGCPEQEVARCSGPDESAPSLGDMRKLIEEQVIKKKLA